MPPVSCSLSIYLFHSSKATLFHPVIRTDSHSMITANVLSLVTWLFVDFWLCFCRYTQNAWKFLVQAKCYLFQLMCCPVSCFLTFMVSECLLLASMAHDRYVAICNPSSIWPQCPEESQIQLVAVPYSYSFLMALFHTICHFSSLLLPLEYHQPFLLR